MRELAGLDFAEIGAALGTSGGGRPADRSTRRG